MPEAERATLGRVSLFSWIAVGAAALAGAKVLRRVESTPRATPLPEGRMRILTGLHHTPAGDRALAYAPKGFVAGVPYTLALYLRGNGSTVESAFRAGLGPLVDAAARNVLFVMPERELSGSGSGRWGTRDAAYQFVLEVLARPDVRALTGSVDPGRVALMSHSGGYQAVAHALTHSPNLRVSGVALFDSLYGYESVLARFAEDPLHSLLNFTQVYADTTNKKSAALRQLLKAAHVPFADWGQKVPAEIPEAARVGFGSTTDAHDLVPARFLARSLRRLCP